MENFTYKGISGSKYVSGEIEAINLDEASHKLKQQKIIITNITKSQKKGAAKSKEKKKSSGSSLFKKKDYPSRYCNFLKTICNNG
jgi:type IV pilus assembly protein PilC